MKTYILPHVLLYFALRRSILLAVFCQAVSRGKMERENFNFVAFSPQPMQAGSFIKRDFFKEKQGFKDIGFPPLSSCFFIHILQNANSNAFAAQCVSF